ncbi:MAG: VWA domain-containing protein [Gammaproteobacteria bacterium]
MDSLEPVFHFAQPGWLWAILLFLPVALWLLLTPRLGGRNERIRQYADAHLLAHLLGRSETTPRSRWMRFARWCGVWILLVLAMAGPRWDFTDVQLFRPGANLLVLFDISRSMNVADVRPTRLARARQELEDLLNQNRGIRVGLIAFASVAHVVSPITEDMNGIRRMLSALDTDLVRLQGSRLSFALDRAAEVIAGQPKDSVNSLLIITDGDFDEPGLEQRLRDSAAEGVSVHILGVGTAAGDAVPGKDGLWIKGRTGQPVVSALNELQLQALAKAGGGIYLQADYQESDTKKILERVKAQALPNARREERTRVWNERFYWFAGLALLLLLPLFRRTLPGYKPAKS